MTGFHHSVPTFQALQMGLRAHRGKKSRRAFLLRKVDVRGNFTRQDEKSVRRKFIASFIIIAFLNNIAFF